MCPPQAASGSKRPRRRTARRAPAPGRGRRYRRPRDRASRPRRRCRRAGVLPRQDRRYCPPPRRRRTRPRPSPRTTCSCNSPPHNDRRKRYGRIAAAGAAAKSPPACRSFPAPFAERPHIPYRRGRLSVEFEIDQCGSDEFQGGKTLVEFARGDEALQQIVRQRLARLVVPGKLPQHLRLLLPVLVELRGQFDEIGEHRGPLQRRIGHIRQHPVQAVAEFVEQGARIVRRQ